MSNSKLTQYQKGWLKSFKKDNPEVGFQEEGDGVTIAYRETVYPMGEFSLSIASPDERKYRRKVGQYWAAMRMAEGIALPCNLQTFDPLGIALNV